MRLPEELNGGKIGVLIADHDILACRLLASRLRKHKSFEVAECAEPAAGVLEMIAKTKPSVAIVSTVLKDAPQGGLAVVREARTAHPSVRSIALLNNPERTVIVEAFRCGAKGVFVRADYDFATLCKCVHRVYQGHIWAESQHLGYVLDAFASENTRPRAHRANGVPQVSRRERDVMRLVVDGLSNREIAAQLGLSEHTVKNYVFRLFEKLGVFNRVELVHYAMAHQELLGADLAIEKAS